MLRQVGAHDDERFVAPARALSRFPRFGRRESRRDAGCAPRHTGPTVPRPIVAFDTETATSRGAPHLIEIAAVRAVSGEIVDRFESMDTSRLSNLRG